MDDADRAFKAAEHQIEQARAENATRLDLDAEPFRALDRLPPSITALAQLERLDLDHTQVSELAPLQSLTALAWLDLANTQVADLRPLQGLTALEILILTGTSVTNLGLLLGLSALKRLWLSGTQVADLRPLQGLTALEVLALSRTQVTDLRPIADLPRLGEGPVGGLWFDDTPAARATPELTRLSQIGNDQQRTRETLAYLGTLPPLPAPLPWEDTGAGDGTPPAAQAAQVQIAFLLDHAATSQVSAATTADQIRHALRDVPASDGNKLPPVLQTMLDVAQVLDRLSRAPIGPDNPDREAELTARIAELEAQVQALTAQLADADAAREAAEALAKAHGFWPNLTRAAGTSIGEQAGLILRTGILSGTVFFLGTNHTFTHALLRAIEALK